MFSGGPSREGGGGEEEEKMETEEEVVTPFNLSHVSPTFKETIPCVSKTTFPRPMHHVKETLAHSCQLSADVKEILLQDWEYYDDSTVLTEFWQKFVDEERDFSKYDKTFY